MQHTTSRRGTIRLIGLGAAGALAGGLALTGTTAAQAADDGFRQLSAPSSVKSGQTFTLKCQVDSGANWKGFPAKVKEKGVPVHAHRIIGSNGDCTMKLVLSAKGKHKLRVIAEGPQNDMMSNWITIRVK